MDTNGSRSKPTVLLSRTTVNQNSRNALRSLVEHEMLAEFWTTFVWDPKSIWNLPLPKGVRRQLERRAISEAPPGLVRSVPCREMVRLGARGTSLENFLCSGERPFSIFSMDLNFDERIARRIRKARPDIIYAYEGAALQTFREARQHEIATIEEQSSGYWRWTRDLLAREAERRPDFADILPTLKDPASRLERKDEELQLADYVFVPSEHVRDTLAGVVPHEKIRMISYGAPEVKPRLHFSGDSSVPLKVLFVGNLGQQKGIGYLFEAMDLLGAMAELTMVGRRLGANARVDEACRRWKWHETLPHSQVLEIMRQADVLVLPSLSEGCALVVLEALACGLPVIITPNTGSLEFVRDGQEGFVVPICQAETIACRLELLHRNREMLAEMSRRAQATAAQRSWERYRDEWAQTIRSLPWR